MSQTNPLTDLDAINEMLASIGQAPITSIETTTNLYEKVGNEYKQLTITTSPGRCDGTTNFGGSIKDGAV